MISELRADFRRFHRSSTPLTAFALLRLAIDHFGLQALIVYRMSRAIHQRADRMLAWRVLRPFARWASRGAGRLYGIYLAPSADIGPGLYIGHSGGIHLDHCRLGAGCSIHQRVRISRAPATSKGPEVGDRVWIGCHSRIEGPLCVGDGATIAAGAVITRDIVARCLVAGNPARVVQRDYDNAAML